MRSFGAAFLLLKCKEMFYLKGKYEDKVAGEVSFIESISLILCVKKSTYY